MIDKSEYLLIIENIIFTYFNVLESIQILL